MSIVFIKYYFWNTWLEAFTQNSEHTHAESFAIICQAPF